MIGEKQPIIAELLVVYRYYFFFLHIQDPYILPFCRQPIYSLYQGYNYSYLMLTAFIGSSYMSNIFAWIVLWVLYSYFSFECYGTCMAHKRHKHRGTGYTRHKHKVTRHTDTNIDVGGIDTNIEVQDIQTSIEVWPVWDI